MTRTADIALVRLWAADTGTGEDQLLTDGQYDQLIEAEQGSLRLAAAAALEVMAVSEVLVSKKIRTQTLSTDGPAVSAELRALAERYRAIAGEISGDYFDIVPTLGGSETPERADHWSW